MNNDKLLINALKNILKRNNISYKELAKNLGISEASVKRLFSEHTFSFNRICKICNFLNIGLAELSEAAELENQATNYTYTETQERYFCKNLKYLAFFDLLLRYGRPKQIQRKYKLTDQEVHTYLAGLDKIKLIQWLPGNKVKFLTSKQVSWRKNGPLTKKLKPLALKEFTEDAFNSSTETMNFLSVELTENSRKQILAKIEDLTEEINKIAALEEKLKLKTTNTGILFALRKWEFSKLTFN